MNKSEMARQSCPRCRTILTPLWGEEPVCLTCGFAKYGPVDQPLTYDENAAVGVRDYHRVTDKVANGDLNTRNVTEDEADNILKLYDQGVAVKDLEKRFSRHNTTIYKTIRRLKELRA